jgi:Amt family ammonium transporter
MMNIGSEIVIVKVFLALLMPAGFSLLATGLCREKNAAHTMFMTFFGSVIAVAGFWICGLALTNRAFGIPHLFLRNQAYNPDLYPAFVSLLPAVIVATCIPIGALAERWRLKSFYVYALFVSMVLFPLFVRWTWGGGWLATFGRGFVDVGGSGVVHALAGLSALAGALVIGPRHGRYSKNGAINPIPAHNVPLALLGNFLLSVGWFGFNTIRSLDAGGASRIDLVAATTALAGAGGAIAAAAYMTITTRRPDPTLVANGLMAGLVASSASVGLVGPNAAFLIGAVSGVLICVAVSRLDRFRVDDPVGAIAVHGLGGLWGVLAAGLFAHGAFGATANVRGLFRGDAGQALAQIVGCGALLVWAFGGSWVFFRILDRVVPLRVEPEVELEGLDTPETGLLGYPRSERPGG